VVDGGPDRQTRWSRLGVWERLLGMAQARGDELGMVFLDSTSIRAHQKAAGVVVKMPLRRVGLSVLRLVATADWLRRSRVLGCAG
jgi:hypothetical protein